MGGAGKVPKLLTSLLLINLCQSSGFGIQGLRGAGVRIYATAVASLHYCVFCLLEGSLLGARGEIIEVGPCNTTMTGTDTGLLVLAR